MATQREVGGHLDIGQPAVSELVATGVLPRPGERGGYDLDACRLAYVRHLRASAAGRDSSRPGSLEAERARVAKEQADMLERRNARERGELVELAPIRDAMIGTVTLTSARLQRVGAAVARGDHKLRARIEAAINDALEDLSETNMETILAAANGGWEPEGED